MLVSIGRLMRISEVVKRKLTAWTMVISMVIVRVWIVVVSMVMLMKFTAMMTPWTVVVSLVLMMMARAVMLNKSMAILAVVMYWVVVFSVMQMWWTVMISRVIALDVVLLVMWCSWVMHVLNVALLLMTGTVVVSMVMR